jgi:hypothetical protein
MFSSVDGWRSRISSSGIASRGPAIDVFTALMVALPDLQLRHRLPGGPPSTFSSVDGERSRTSNSSTASQGGRRRCAATKWKSFFDL